MRTDLPESSSSNRHPEVTLDGQSVRLPAHPHSVAAIRSYLESIALERQRILWSFNVEDAAVDTTGNAARIAAQTVGLEQMPLLLVDTAAQQTAHAHSQAQTAVSQVMINEAPRARELWWSLVRVLKQPLLTLSLLPDAACPSPAGSASPLRLRQWQLQQLAGILRDVDEAGRAGGSLGLSDALEQRVLPWLESLQDSLDLLRMTLLSAPTAASTTAPESYAGKDSRGGH